MITSNTPTSLNTEIATQMTTDIIFTLHEITNHRTIKTSYSESPYQIALIATFKPGGNS